MQNVLVLLNAKAGTILDRDQAEVRKAVESGLAAPGRTVEVRLLAGDELGKAIRAAGRSEHDTVIIGGGDGSVSIAARSLAHSGKTFGILPLGTLNLLARDLGMPLELDEAVAALGSARESRIDLATLNGDLFHTISGTGFFSQMARAREMARRWKLWRFLAVAIAAVLALRRAGRFTLDVTVDGEARTVEAFAALVTVNRFAGPGWRRARLDEGLLEVHIAEDRGAMAKLKAGADMVTDTWRDNPGILSFEGREIVLTRRRRSRIWVSTDGELNRERVPLRYTVQPDALTVLVPAARPDNAATPQRGSIS
ncbi:diacylglycerol/lipid kinase family protein [Ancylobacter terrae]|uniref:diacylglycerol/lipid kinase family protein n=1 Tax=Ancylobacter sp. sgz301288 TaxID=3342077 RepID=UPI003859050B